MKKALPVLLLVITLIGCESPMIARVQQVLTVEAVRFSPEPRTDFYTAQTIELLTETQGALILYTLDGSEPSSENPNAMEYHEGYPLSTLEHNEVLRIRAMAYKEDMTPSSISSAQYMVIYPSPAPPAISAESLGDPLMVQQRNNGLTVTDGSSIELTFQLSDDPLELDGIPRWNREDLRIHYSLDGHNPDQNSPSIEPGGNVLISLPAGSNDHEVNVSAIVYAPEPYPSSSYLFQSYRISYGELAQPPVFYRGGTPLVGSESYDQSFQLTLQSPEASAEILYKIRKNQDPWTEEWISYSSAIEIFESSIDWMDGDLLSIQAKCRRSGLLDSDVITRNFIFQSQVLASPEFYRTSDSSLLISQSVIGPGIELGLRGSISAARYQYCMYSGNQGYLTGNSNDPWVEYTLGSSIPLPEECSHNDILILSARTTMGGQYSPLVTLYVSVDKEGPGSPLFDLGRRNYINAEDSSFSFLLKGQPNLPFSLELALSPTAASVLTRQGSLDSQGEAVIKLNGSDLDLLDNGMTKEVLLYIRAELFDELGNGSTALDTIALDRVSPPAPKIEPNLFYDRNGTPAINLETVDTAYIEVSTMGGGNGFEIDLEHQSGVILENIPLSQGRIDVNTLFVDGQLIDDDLYRFVVREMDSAGNWSDPAYLNFTKDTQAPGPIGGFSVQVHYDGDGNINILPQYIVDPDCTESSLSILNSSIDVANSLFDHNEITSPSVPLIRPGDENGIYTFNIVSRDDFGNELQESFETACGVLLVDANSSATVSEQDGLSWDSAYSTLDSRIGGSSESWREIWIKGDIVLEDNLSFINRLEPIILIGGVQGTELLSREIPSDNRSFLDMENSMLSFQSCNSVQIRSMNFHNNSRTTSTWLNYIEASYVDLAIRDCSFSTFDYRNTRAIDIESGYLSISDVSFEKFKPAILSHGVTTRLDRVEFFNNGRSGSGGVSYGGAIQAYGGRLLVFDSWFTENHSLNAGGAVFLGKENGVDPVYALFYQSIFSENSCDTASPALPPTRIYGGGAIYSDNARLYILDNLFYLNTVDRFGAAIAINGSVSGSRNTTSINNSIFVSNNCVQSSFRRNEIFLWSENSECTKLILNSNRVSASESDADMSIHYYMEDLFIDTIAKRRDPSQAHRGLMDGILPSTNMIYHTDVPTISFEPLSIIDSHIADVGGTAYHDESLLSESIYLDTPVDINLDGDTNDRLSTNSIPFKDILGNPRISGGVIDIGPIEQQ